LPATPRRLVCVSLASSSIKLISARKPFAGSPCSENSSPGALFGSDAENPTVYFAGGTDNLECTYPGVEVFTLELDAHFVLARRVR